MHVTGSPKEGTRPSSRKTKKRNSEPGRVGGKGYLGRERGKTGSAKIAGSLKNSDSRPSGPEKSSAGR